MCNLQIVEKILGRIFIMNHNIIPLMLQVRWFQHISLLRTILGKSGMMIEHMWMRMEILKDGFLMDQTSLSFKI